MILLDSAQADKVRGISPTNSFAALDPVPLKDGTWMLPDEVLSDPAHADVRDFLAPLPKQTVDKLPIYDAAVPADVTAFRSKMSAKDFHAVVRPAVKEGG